MPDQPESAPSPPEAPLTLDAAAQAAAAEQKRQKKKDKARLAWMSFVGRIVAQIVGAVATIFLGLYIVQRQTSPPAPAPEAGPTPVRPKSARPPGTTPLAVLPLENLSGDASQDYFADGMTEALITELAQIDALHVISRTSSMHYKGQRKPITQIARELDVDFIVEGSVVKSGDRVRVTAQLIDGATDQHLWAKTYDRTLKDVLVLQTEVAQSVVKEVNVSLSPRQAERLQHDRPVDPRVYDLYLKGRQAWAKRTPESLSDALRYFDEAIATDPSFAPGFAGLSDTYYLLGLSVFATTTPADAMARARNAAERAIALDDTLAQAHVSLAAVNHRFNWDWAGADREFRRALELNPGYATARHWYAIFLAEQGRDRDAMVEAERALALDPFSANVHRNVGLVHYYARRFEEAASAQRRSLELDPGAFASRLVLAWTLIEQNKPREAIALWDASVALRTHPQASATLAYAYAKLGDRRRADDLKKDVLAAQATTGISTTVRLHAGLDESDATFAALDRAFTDRADIVTALRVDPIFNRVRTDPRYTALLKRLPQS